MGWKIYLWEWCIFSVEGKLHDSNWGEKNYRGCDQSSHLKDWRTVETVCAMNPSDSLARTLTVCQLMDQLWDKKDVVTIHIALGACKSLLDKDGIPLFWVTIYLSQPITFYPNELNFYKIYTNSMHKNRMVWYGWSVSCWGFWIFRNKHGKCFFFQTHEKIPQLPRKLCW